MAFQVKYQGNTSKDDHGDDATFEVLEGGVLKVVSADTDGKVAYIAAGVWKTVFADKDHVPGRTKRKPGEGRRGRAAVIA